MDDVWSLMKKYRFDILNDTNKNISCTICNGLLINAHSSPCACVYCFDCIRDYLDGMEKVCPGQSDECKGQMININKNVFPDNITNRNVLRTIVKCPRRNCVFKNELRNIGDHIRVCNDQSMQCPFLNIGCKDVDFVEEDIKKHLLQEIVGHSKLMLDSMDNLRNQMELMKKNLTVLTKENKDLKKEIRDLKEETVSKIKDLVCRVETEDKDKEESQRQFEGREIKYDENDSRDTVREKIDEILAVNIDLRSKIDNELRLQLDLNKESIVKIEDNNKKNIDEMRNEMATMKKVEMTNKRLVEELKKKCERQNGVLKEFKEIIEMRRKEMEKEKERTDKIDKSILNINEKLNEFDKNLTPQIGGEFMWKIDKWKEKSECARSGTVKDFYSHSFYSHRNGYKMCLCVYPNGDVGAEGSHLSVCFCLMRGEFDDILPWPFKYDVILELIDQKTKQIYTKDTVKYEDNRHKNIAEDAFQDNKNVTCFRWAYAKFFHYEKPMQERNLGVGSPKFVTLSDVANHNGLCENDQLFIRCRVKFN